MPKKIFSADDKSRLLSVLIRHVGRERAIGMDVLSERVFGRPVRHKINDTRTLRALIDQLRADGEPILSTSTSAGGGYYIAAAGSETEEYLGRLHRRGLKPLALEAKIRKISLPELLGQMQLRLTTGSAE